MTAPPADNAPRRPASAATGASPCRWPCSSAAWSAWPSPPCRSTASSARPPAMTARRGARPPRRPGRVDREITVRFDANVSSALPWDFSPEQRADAREDRRDRAGLFHARRTTRATPLTGTAIFNVTPEIAGALFQQDRSASASPSRRLPPGETRRDAGGCSSSIPPIADDATPSDVEDDHASYTFFPLPMHDRRHAGARSLAGRRQKAYRS